MPVASIDRTITFEQISIRFSYFSVRNRQVLFANILTVIYEYGLEVLGLRHSTNSMYVSKNLESEADR